MLNCKLTIFKWWYPKCHPPNKKWISSIWMQRDNISLWGSLYFLHFYPHQEWEVCKLFPYMDAHVRFLIPITTFASCSGNWQTDKLSALFLIAPVLCPHFVTEKNGCCHYCTSWQVNNLEPSFQLIPYTCSPPPDFLDDKMPGLGCGRTCRSRIPNGFLETLRLSCQSCPTAHPTPCIM